MNAKRIAVAGIEDKLFSRTCGIVFGGPAQYSPGMKPPFVRGVCLLFVLGFTGALFSAEAPLTGGKWIDLTHDFSTNTLYWPTAQRFTLETEFHAHTEKGYFYSANRYSASEHGGTHIDAPIHFAENGKALD